MNKLSNYLIFCLFGTVLVNLNSCSKNDGFDFEPIAYGSVTDIDGNVYNTITIEIPEGMSKSSNGRLAEATTQTWMVENLKTTRYRNGDSIPNVTEGEDWSLTSAGVSHQTGAYCQYNNDPSISLTYGLLYNWYAVIDNRNIAPEGWHVPTESEWMTLIDFLGGLGVAGGRLKEAGTAHWAEPNTGADNSIGFTALPGGARWGGYGATGSFHVLDSCAYFWTSSRDHGHPGEQGWGRRVGLYLTSQGVQMADSKAENGFSIRCIKDY
jgi:uncharacterized protein (TIGR02145 family)